MLLSSPSPDHNTASVSAATSSSSDPFTSARPSRTLRINRDQEWTKRPKNILHKNGEMLRSYMNMKPSATPTTCTRPGTSALARSFSRISKKTT